MYKVGDPNEEEHGTHLCGPSRVRVKRLLAQYTCCLDIVLLPTAYKSGSLSEEETYTTPLVHLTISKGIDCLIQSIPVVDPTAKLFIIDVRNAYKL
jgi:hypothetical protein